MLDKTALMKELETHLDFMTGTMGELLKGCYNMIRKQGKTITKQNKQIKALKAMQRMYIARVKVADRK